MGGGGERRLKRRDWGGGGGGAELKKDRKGVILVVCGISEECRGRIDVGLVKKQCCCSGVGGK